LVGAFLVLTPGVAAAQGTPPPNDSSSSPTAITPGSWTGLVTGEGNPLVIATTDWGPATIGADDMVYGPPTCVGSIGYRSLWYSVSIPAGQAADIRVTVQSDDPSRYQPVVTILDPTGPRELACGLASNTGTNTTQASATAYVTGGVQYLVRVAEVDNNGPQGAGPELVLRTFGLDHTPPTVTVKAPAKILGKGQSLTFDPTGTADGLSGVNWGTAQWYFHDGPNHSGSVPAVPNATGAVKVSHVFHSSGYHRIEYSVADMAGNTSDYTFFVYIHDFVPPQIARFGARSVPYPRARHMTLIVQHNESVHVSVTIVQGPYLMYNGTLRMLGSRTTHRGIKLRRPVQRFGLLTMSGVARDLAGNSTLLPVCSLDPFSGRGVCHSLVPKPKR
jgi:hypothetical protein